MITSQEIHYLLTCPKEIILPNNWIFPVIGEEKQVILRSDQEDFLLRINRKGLKSQQFSLQCEKQESMEWFIRLDMRGVGHKNQEGPYKNKTIPTPHLHIPRYLGDSAPYVYPINEKYAKMYLSKDERTHHSFIFSKFLKYINVQNSINIRRSEGNEF